MTAPCRLGGRGVLVTRPTAQAENLCRLIAEAGGTPIPFPTVEILPAADRDRARALFAEPWDRILFVSRNAVDQARPLIPSTGLAGNPLLGAVGRATAAALHEVGLPPDLVPNSGFDSEALLALPELTEVAGRRVLIVRGDGGRTLLGDMLAERGAETHYAEVYRRGLPAIDAAPLLPRWRQQVGFVTATSDEILANLVALVGTAGRDWLLATPLVVISARGAEGAARQGFRQIDVADEASDAGVVKALCRLAGKLIPAADP
jgi:uroporphyrinogen-III synthase